MERAHLIKTVLPKMLLIAGALFMLLFSSIVKVSASGEVWFGNLEINQTPVANAGPDQSVNTLVLVTLDGSLSSDPDGNIPLAYQWTQTGGTAVTLTGGDTVSPTFTAPGDPTELIFSLVVTDSLSLASTADMVTITVNNQAPVANAGPNQSVNTLVLVTLDGSLSSDPDGDTPLTYQWTQTGGTVVTLTGWDTVSPTFTAPADPAELIFSLVVTDSLGLASAADSVTVMVTNQAPIANAGEDQTVVMLSLVTLSGSLSSDPDGDLPLTYAWSQTGGTAVTLTGGDTVSPTFTAPADPAELIFSLLVTDSLGLASVSDTVTVTVTNQAPIANAGEDQTAATLSLVTLDGNLSSDPDGNTPLAYAWTQTTGAAVTLTGGDTVSPTFTAPADPAELIFSLVVTDSLGLASVADTVTVTVTNQAPNANAGEDQTAATLSLVTLSGSLSSDPDGDIPLIYHWTQTGGTAVTLTGGNTVSPTFTAPGDPAALTFLLVVTDSLGLASVADTVAVTVTNQAPIANAGPNQSVSTSVPVTLDGTSSSDPDADLPLAYSWTQTGGPSVTLSSYSVAKPTFLTPASSSVLTFSLVVTDSLGLVDPTPDSVTITVTYAPPKRFLPYIQLGLNLPSSFTKLSPANLVVNEAITPTLSWSAAKPVTWYEYCYDTTNDGVCTSWIGNGTSTTVVLPPLLYNTKYFWQVRAWNQTVGPVYANDAPTAFWSFTTGKLPAAFNKTSPSNGATNQSLTPTLKWGTTTPLSHYEYCYDTTNDNLCSNWISTGTSTSVVTPPLQGGTKYYWQVRAWNLTIGPTYANGSATAFWSFTTLAANPILNGGFESGDVNWSEYSSNGYDLILNTSQDLPISPHTGSWLAWLGGGYDETSAIWQSITIPVGRSILHYWFYSHSTDLCDYDFYGIFFGETLVRSGTVCYSNDTNAWVHKTLDLTLYAGMTNSLTFMIDTDSTYFSSIFLDDISFEVTTTYSAEAGISPPEDLRLLEHFPDLNEIRKEDQVEE